MHVPPRGIVNHLCQGVVLRPFSKPPASQKPECLSPFLLRRCNHRPVGAPPRPLNVYAEHGIDHFACLNP